MPLARSAAHQRRAQGRAASKRTALGVLSSDCISSSAYGSEEILLVLIPLFDCRHTLLLPMTGIVLVVLVLVTLTYRWVVTTYTAAGGSYVVARENFGRSSHRWGRSR